jgi:hypothetical protein
MTTTLVLRNNTTLPTCCSKCGTADAREAKLVDFRHRPLWARLLGSLGRLFEREASFCFWLCPRCSSRWKWSQPASIVVFLLSIVVWLAFGRFGLPLMLSYVDGIASLVIALVFLFSFVPFLYVADFAVEMLVHRPLVVSARGITKDGMVTLSGLHPNVGAELTKG